MKHHHTRRKKIVVLVCTFILIVGSYLFKQAINHVHYQNKHFLATTLRKKQADDFSYHIIESDQLFTKSSLEHYGHKQFIQKKIPFLIKLNNTQRLEQNRLKPIRIFYTIDDVYGSRLFLEYRYPILKQATFVPDFQLESAKQVAYLNKSQMLYSIVLQTSALPSEWLTSLAPYVEEIKKDLHDETTDSLVYIKTNHEHYLYLTQVPNHLFTIESLS